jgi:hypothetical protein
MTTLTPADHAALPAMRRAARDLRLKAAIAAYESCGFWESVNEAIERAEDYILEDKPRCKPN